MSPPDSQRLSVTVTPSFGDTYVAALTVMRQGFWRIVIVSIFPLAGILTIGILVYALATGHRMGTAEVLKGLFISLLSLMFPLYLPALLIWLARRNSRHLLGPVEYAFDEEGMHVSGPAIQQNISWPAILRVRRTRRFILIFLTEKSVYPIPLRQISDPHFFDNLQAIGGAQTDFGADRPPITNQPAPTCTVPSEIQPPTTSAAPQGLSLTIRASFWEMVSANFAIIRHRPQSVVIFSIYPLIGILILAFSLRELAAGRRLDTAGVLRCLLLAPQGILSPLLIVMFSVWSARRSNKLAQGPVVYAFDTEGMHLSGAALQSKILWSGILRVRHTRRFILIFMTPTQAHVIPLRQVDNPHLFEDLRALAGAQTDFGPGR